ncbi:MULTISPECIES: hypothetical protein [unclassified Pseudoalteromonas]|uniref:hypothetical protein n=1 Tax=unclassified Pseudoalteromonas TaxID=194690 RepID=UPI000CF6B2AD|nr:MULTISPECIES: hypothetical protein [unclassified Pseudoalteromonas]MBS3798163.1 hypothetical protein [Pseudoalteromonas sp. BDTF-M6]
MDLFDIFQQYRLEQTKTEAAERTRQVDRKATDNQYDIVELQSKVDHLSLVCMAMSELLEEVGFNRELLLSKMKEIDLRDGTLDGKFAPANVCGSCARVVSARHYTCLYCGTKIDKTSAF